MTCAYICANLARPARPARPLSSSRLQALAPCYLTLDHGYNAGMEVSSQLIDDPILASWTDGICEIIRGIDSAAIIAIRTQHYMNPPLVQVFVSSLTFGEKTLWIKHLSIFVLEGLSKIAAFDLNEPNSIEKLGAMLKRRLNDDQG